MLHAPFGVCLGKISQIEVRQPVKTGERIFLVNNSLSEKRRCIFPIKTMKETIKNYTLGH